MDYETKLKEELRSIGFVRNDFTVKYCLSEGEDGTYSANISIEGPCANAISALGAITKAADVFLEKLAFHRNPLLIESKKTDSLTELSSCDSDIGTSSLLTKFNDLSAHLKVNALSSSMDATSNTSEESNTSAELTESSGILLTPSRSKNSSMDKYFQTKDFADLLKKFEESKAKFPEAMRISAQPSFDKIMLKFLEQMQSENYVAQLQYQGSIYEKIKINSTPLKFNVMAVLQSTKKEFQTEKCENDMPGFVRLKTLTADVRIRWNIEDGEYLCTDKVLQQFYGKLDIFLKKNDFKSLGVELSLHGCAIKLKILLPDNSSHFYIDIVPAVKCGDDFFVCRSFSNDERTTWRISTSKNEVQIFKTIDKDKGCRRNVLRIVKALVNSEKKGQLAKLPSYILKTVLLHMNEDQSIDWSLKNIHNCVVDMLVRLKTHLETRNLCNFFIPTQCLLPVQKYSDAVLATMSNYISNLLSSQTKIEKTFNIIS